MPEHNKIAEEILQTVEFDQNARQENPIDWDKVTKIDKKNTKRIKGIIDQIGWPTIECSSCIF